MRFANQSLVFVVGNHHDTVFALPGDALWPLGSRQPEYFTEASFRSLNLPGAPCYLDIEIDLAGRAVRGGFSAFFANFWYSLQTGLTSHSLGNFTHSCNRGADGRSLWSACSPGRGLPIVESITHEALFSGSKVLDADLGRWPYGIRRWPRLSDRFASAQSPTGSVQERSREPSESHCEIARWRPVNHRP